MAMQNIYNYERPKVMPRVMNNIESKPQYNGNARRESTKTDNYLEQKIMSAKPEELTLMLYEGMVRFIKQAMLYNEQKNIEKTNNSIQRAQDIVTELNITLDKSYEVSTNLELMYDYMTRRLMDANIQKDSKILEEVLGYADDLKNTWKQAMTLAK